MTSEWSENRMWNASMDKDNQSLRRHLRTTNLRSRNRSLNHCKEAQQTRRDEMTASRGLLQNRAILVAVLLFCAYESVTVWLTITKYARFPHDPVSLFGLALAAFITTSISLRSRFLVDRVVFGAVTLTLLLTATRLARLSSDTMVAVKAAEALVWTIAAVVCLAVLFGAFRTPSGNN